MRCYLSSQHDVRKVGATKLAEKLHSSVKERKCGAALVAKADSDCTARQAREQPKSCSWSESGVLKLQ
jgi:hypothetical protein